MNKIINKDNISSWILFGLSLLIAGLFIGSLPDEIPIHFNINGTIDNYGNKFMIFLMPLTMFVMLLGSTLAKNKEKQSKTSDKYYYQIVFLSNIVIILLEIYIIAVSFEIKVMNAMNLALILVGVLIVVIGNVMPKFGQGKWIGVRTKWTLADETVWFHTHRFCAKLWFVGGILFVGTVFLKGIPKTVSVIAIAFILTLLPILYSKVEYEKLANRG
ncbi:SdpI family protein [Anaerosporobacter sp.]|uniref:SdpI family protein n=1 Tax=Anaerosporobacter sp. TaxID=1872529 RepID=UPI00286F859F|nr:SdpI family protein [Anaerosporobacter sp.]